MESSAGTTECPLLVVVTGPPASGKTTLARALASRLRVTVLSKDTFKETLYDAFGSGDEIEQRIDQAGVSLLTAAAAEQLDSDLPVIVEGYFDRDDQQLLCRLVAEHAATLVQVYCDRPDQEVIESFRERLASRRRHRGHRDQPEDESELARGLRDGDWQPLDLEVPLLRTRPEHVTRVLAWLDENHAS